MGETDESSGSLIIESDGHAEMDIENDFHEDESYSLDIDELSENQVDLQIYDDTGTLIADYDDYDDIIEDTYEGQAVTTSSVILCVGIAALLSIAVTYVWVESGVTYCIAEALTKAITPAKAKAIEKVDAKVEEKKKYFPEMARAAIRTAGYTPVDSHGHTDTKHYDYHKRNEGTQLPHYHKGIMINGKWKKSGSSHSLFSLNFL